MGYENMHSVRPDQYYTDVIARPMTGIGRKPQAGREVEVVAEDEQQFLSRQQQYLAQGLPPSQGQGGAMPPGVQKTPDRKVVGSPGVQGSPKKMDPSAVKPAGATTSEGVLANFFNSLLSKKTGGMAGSVGQPNSLTGLTPGQAGPPPKGGSPQPDDYKATVRSDAAAELDRLTRNQKKSVSNSSSVEGSGGTSLPANSSEC